MAVYSDLIGSQPKPGYCELDVQTWSDLVRSGISERHLLLG